MEPWSCPMNVYSGGVSTSTLAASASTYPRVGTRVRSRTREYLNPWVILQWVRIFLTHPHTKMRASQTHPFFVRRRRLGLVRHDLKPRRLRCCFCRLFQSCCRISAGSALVPPRDGEVVGVQGDDAATEVIVAPAVRRHRRTGLAARADGHRHRPPPPTSSFKRSNTALR